MGSKLKQLFEMTRNLDVVVVFIDEFEEIAGSSDNASRTDKTITNEFLFNKISHFTFEKEYNDGKGFRVTHVYVFRHNS